MSKKAIKDYLPLFWVKNMEKQKTSSIGDVTGEDLFKLVSYNASVEEQVSVYDKYPSIQRVYEQLMHDPVLRRDVISDFDAMSSMLLWSKSKQVYKFDKDFIDALIKTDNLRVPVDAFDYLPYKHFYVDISDNRDVCNNVLAEGFFVNVEKVVLSEDDKNEDFNCDSAYIIHICKIDNKYFYNGVVMIPNHGRALPAVPETMETVELIETEDYTKFIKDTGKVNTKLYNVLIIQTLLYLSSMKPDIEENQETKRTYRPSTGKPKNKYSEIRKWDVGVRYGASFRKWKTDSSTRNTSNKHNGKGTGKRPHPRRAHWHSYWYKEDDGSRVLRQLWLSEMFINKDLIKNNDDNPTVIHDVIQ